MSGTASRFQTRFGYGPGLRVGQFPGPQEASRVVPATSYTPPTPTPLTPPRRPGQAMNEGAADALGGKAAASQEGS